MRGKEKQETHSGRDVVHKGVKKTRAVVVVLGVWFVVGGGGVLGGGIQREDNGHGTEGGG